eukprot:PhF_6_TR19624/c0_g1_i1/m.28634
MPSKLAEYFERQIAQIDSETPKPIPDRPTKKSTPKRSLSSKVVPTPPPITPQPLLPPLPLPPTNTKLTAKTLAMLDKANKTSSTSSGTSASSSPSSSSSSISIPNIQQEFIQHFFPKSVPSSHAVDLCEVISWCRTRVHFNPERGLFRVVRSPETKRNVDQKTLVAKESKNRRAAATPPPKAVPRKEPTKREREPPAADPITKKKVVAKPPPPPAAVVSPPPDENSIPIQETDTLSCTICNKTFLLIEFHHSGWHIFPATKTEEVQQATKGLKKLKKENNPLQVSEPVFRMLTKECTYVCSPKCMVAKKKRTNNCST